MYKKDGDSLLLSKILEYVILIVMIYVAFMMGEHYMEFLKGLISDSGIQTLIGVFLVTVMGITKLILDNNDLTNLNGKIFDEHKELSGKISREHAGLSGKISGEHKELNGKINEINTDLKVLSTKFSNKTEGGKELQSILSELIDYNFRNDLQMSKILIENGKLKEEINKLKEENQKIKIKPEKKYIVKKDRER
jgi:tRNA nucleotidyltransferase/poly(A) polymerase